MTLPIFPRFCSCLALSTSVWLVAPPGIAQTEATSRPEGEQDSFSIQARSATTARLFQRALLPGPNGAIVDTDTLAPFYEHLVIRVRDLDSPLGRDSLDLEFSGWGSGVIGDVGDAGWLEGDLTVAKVKQRIGPAHVALGRQVVTGGAARFAHFDGLSAGVVSSYGLGASLYGGFSVLPRWDQRPQYRHLGALPDTLLRDSDAVPAPERSGFWLAGGRLSYELGQTLNVGLSAHEQREASELSRRNAGLDFHVTPLELLSVSGQGILDLDSTQIADARLIVDVYPSKQLDLAAQYQHAEPSLFLSRQSVLSVFAVDGYDEVGGEARYRFTRHARVDAGAFALFYPEDPLGMRASLGTRIEPLSSDRAVLKAGYTRLSQANNGYHALRLGVSYRLVEPVLLAADHYTYFYDNPIRGFSYSLMEVLSSEISLGESWRVLAGTSLTRSPYAALDTQALVRLTYTFDAEPGSTL